MDREETDSTRNSGRVYVEEQWMICYGKKREVTEKFHALEVVMCYSSSIILPLSLYNISKAPPLIKINHSVHFKISLYFSFMCAAFMMMPSSTTFEDKINVFSLFLLYLAAHL